MNSAIPLDDVRRMIRDSAEGLIAGVHAPRRLRALRTSETGWDRETWQAIAEAGWLALRVPEERGGAGLSLGHVATVCEVAGGALLPEPLIACGLMPTLLLADDAASPAMSEALLPGVMAGETVLTLAWQEQPHATDPASCATRIAGGRLAGTKRFVPGAVGADGLLVTARQTDGAIAILHVPVTAAGLTITPVRQVDGSIAADIVFDGVAVPEDALLLAGPAAEAALRRAIAEATVALSVTLAALARRALEMTVDYLGKRVQFGKPIGSFQALQHRAVDLAIRTRLAEAACREALRRCEAEGHEAAATEISAAKAIAANTALFVGREAIQLHGGMGYTDEADIGLYLKAALRLSPWLGTARHHRDVVLAATRAQRKAVRHG